MDFYEMLSEYYDEIFLVSDDELSFLFHQISDMSDRILDIACGTGQYSISLQNKGLKNIEAIDLDPDMVKKARIKSSEIDFKVGNMLDLKNYYIRPFDYIFCIGTSIAHLNDLTEVEKFLKDTFSLLNKGGKLVLQIINFDRIVSGNISKLPTIERDDLIFERKYIHREKIVIFVGILTKGTKKYEAKTELLILKHDDMISLLVSTGYIDIKTFGSFSGDRYDKDTSYAFIVSAKKPI